MTRECLTTQARLPGTGRDEQPVITSTKWIIALVSTVLQLIEWKAFAGSVERGAELQRGVIGQWQDVGRAGFDLLQHGGCRDPAGSAVLLSALPLTDSFLLSRSRGEHSIVQLLVDILGRCCRWASGKQDEETLPAQGGIANVDPAGWN